MGNDMTLIWNIRIHFLFSSTKPIPPTKVTTPSKLWMCSSLRHVGTVKQKFIAKWYSLFIFFIFQCVVRLSSSVEMPSEYRRFLIMSLHDCILPKVMIWIAFFSLASILMKSQIYASFRGFYISRYQQENTDVKLSCQMYTSLGLG